MSVVPVVVVGVVQLAPENVELAVVVVFNVQLFNVVVVVLGTVQFVNLEGVFDTAQLANVDVAVVLGTVQLLNTTGVVVDAMLQPVMGVAG